MFPTVAYDETKLCELVLYISVKSASDPAFGATKLNKLLFFADFGHYAATGASITGASYRRQEHGPVPRRILPAKRTLEATGAAREEEGRYGPFPQRRMCALRPPDLTRFTSLELATVDGVISRYRGLTGSEISALSHRLQGWRLAAMYEEIPYFSACLPESPLPLSAAEVAWARAEGVRLLGRTPDA